MAVARTLRWGAVHVWIDGRRMDSRCATWDRLQYHAFAIELLAANKLLLVCLLFSLSVFKPWKVFTTLLGTWFCVSLRYVSWCVAWVLDPVLDRSVPREEKNEEKGKAKRCQPPFRLNEQ